MNNRREHWKTKVTNNPTQTESIQNYQPENNKKSNEWVANNRHSRLYSC